MIMKESNLTTFITSIHLFCAMVYGVKRTSVGFGSLPQHKGLRDKYLGHQCEPFLLLFFALICKEIGERPSYQIDTYF